MNPKSETPRSGRANRRPPMAAPAVPDVPDAPAVSWCVAVVHAVDGEGLMVEIDALHRPAVRAAGCLLAPAAGDSVACLQTPQGVWVLSVLQQATCHAGVLRLQGDTRIELTEGTLALHAPRLELHSELLQVRAGEARLALESAELVGRHLRVIGSVVKVVGSVLSTVMDRVNHYSRHYLRTTDGIDRVAATHLECEAKQLLRLSGEHTLVNGEKLVKARGAQIHFG